MVVFTDSDHSYRNISTGKRYVSVTQLIKKYETPFDGQYWSMWKAMQEMDFPFSLVDRMCKGDIICMMAHLPVEQHEICLARAAEIKATWNKGGEDAANSGTENHLIKETTSIKNKVELNPFTNKLYKVIEKPQSNYDNYSTVNCLSDLEDGFHPELVLWNDEIGISGQSDKPFLETIDGIRYADISDYKFIKKIKKVSYYNKYSREYSMLKPPLSHLMDCNWIKYNLQLSLYGWMLERAGFVVRHLGLEHNGTTHIIAYLRDEIINMLKDYKSKQHIKN